MQKIKHCATNKQLRQGVVTTQARRCTTSSTPRQLVGHNKPKGQAPLLPTACMACALHASTQSPEESKYEFVVLHMRSASSRSHALPIGVRDRGILVLFGITIVSVKLSGIIIYEARIKKVSVFEVRVAEPAPTHTEPSRIVTRTTDSFILSV